ncbi:hypothetical protein AMS68_007251 [Peltaster fructicola]|uniref:Uncharacterized protein n=1 Tax=Peltaster fructicola TaxID=286661 RepID=A0A6H0Y3Z8_9PEZI|nr:hypothetical protein AMS68_007251 [Peltaster fructicola]
MGLETVDKLYTASDFTALTEHNAQTPASFFEGAPVLHLSCAKSSIILAKGATELAPELTKLSTVSEMKDDGTSVLEDIDIWVTSRFFILGSKATTTSVRIDYPTIVVHAQTDASVMMVLRVQDDDMSDEDDCAQINILPSQAEGGADPAETASSSLANGDSGKNFAMLLYQAIGECQELNPDPEMDESDDGDMDMQATGFPAGGWITSDNMHEFTDEQGNLRMPTSSSSETALGPGAGNVRTAADYDEDQDDAKWQRTG